MIKIIFFDIGGVLFKVGDFENDFIPQRFGFNRKEFSNHFGKYSDMCESGKISDNEYFRMTSKKFGVSPKKLKKEWLELYTRKNRQNKAVFKIAHQLKASGYKLGIISNTKRIYSTLRKKIGDLSIFNPKITSYKAKIMKPDKRIFALACRLAKVKPAEAVFIDDRIVNVRGSRASGMKAIHYRNPAQLKKYLRKLGMKF